MKTFFLFAVIVAQVSFGQQSNVLTRQEVVHDLFSNAAVLDRSVSVMYDESPSGEKKSPALAVVYSLLLPGMGELYVGNYSSGKYFTIAEGVLWVALGSVQWYATWLQDDARNFATQHANVVQEGKDGQYFIDIENANNVYEFNEAVLRTRNIFRVYDPNSSYYWKWDNDVNRAQYHSYRVSGDNMFNNTQFIAAAIATNHLISAINAGRMAISHNNEANESGRLDIHADVMSPLGYPDGIKLSVVKNF